MYYEVGMLFWCMSMGLMYCGIGPKQSLVLGFISFHWVLESAL